MAAIDKIYGTDIQYKEFKAWLEQNKPEALRYLYSNGWEHPDWSDGEDHPISNFPEHIDAWLLANCPIDWVIEQVKEQYGLPESENWPEGEGLSDDLR